EDSNTRNWLGHHSWQLVRSLKAVQLLFFDAVFHLAPRAVILLIEPLGLAFPVGDHVARVGPVGVVLGFDDDAPLAIPAVGLVLKRPKEAHFLLNFLMLGCSVGLQLG